MTTPSVRIRQLVFASNASADMDLLGQILGLGTPFVDPGVGEFGLTNNVYALGDQFLEVVVPTEANTAAGRFIDRSGGEGGYMAIFQTDDLDGVRSRADAMGIRRVWNIDLADIAASHLHPADIGAAIVSIDEPKPAPTWRWGGPDWDKRAVPGQIVGATVTARDPGAFAGRWADVLGLKARPEGDGYRIDLVGGAITVNASDTDRLETFQLSVPDPDAVLARARSAGLPVEGMTFKMIGVTIDLAAD